MDNNVVVEEDWSSHIQDSSLNGFAEYVLETIDLHVGQAIKLKCVKALTPLDMIKLSSGHYDATGNRLWMGAHFFTRAFVHLEKSLFTRKRVMEVGSGTGFGGIALLMLCDHADCAPTKLVLTDSNRSALELCRQNCELNFNHDERITIRYLDWNDDGPNSVEMFDTMLGTDLIYDVSVLIPLLSTVSKYLTKNGVLILSHIPRASLPGESKIASTEEMEKHILHQAIKYRLRLTDTLRPLDLPRIAKDRLGDLLSMQDAGAALLLFVKE
jgi:predicted O-methyltransferase YrrM